MKHCEMKYTMFLSVNTAGNKIMLYNVNCELLQEKAIKHERLL